MKKLVLAMAAILLLTGCSQPETPDATRMPTTQSETATLPTETTEPAPDGLYLPDSAMERSTGGAVRTYELKTGSVTSLSLLGEHLLAADDSRTLYLLEGDQAVPLRVRAPKQPGTSVGQYFQRTDSGASYYDAREMAVVTLDENLVGGARYVLPTDSGSRPLLAGDLSKLYYVTAEGIFTMDLQKGTARLLREEQGDTVELNSLLFDDTLLQYTRRRSDGAEEVCFIDPDSGSLISVTRFRGTLQSRGDRFQAMLQVPDALGEEQWILSGTREGAESRLVPAEGWGGALLLEDGKILLQRQNKVGLELACLDLETGAQLGRILLPRQRLPMTLACADGGSLWLSSGESGRFYRWIMEESDRKSAASLEPYASLAAPDEAAREAVELRRQELEEQLDIRLTLTGAEQRTEGIDYDSMPDYYPAQSLRAMDALEQAAGRLPEDFLRQLGRRSHPLQVELTDRFDPAWPPATGTGSMDLTGGEIRLQADMSTDLEAVFYHELWHILEVRIRNDSDILHRWDRLNPEGFSYTGAVEPDPESYAGATADGYGMVSAREDRAQIFAYACMENQAERFTQPVLQQKLRFLCELLRDRYDLEGDPVWEQYLTEE